MATEATIEDLPREPGEEWRVYPDDETYAISSHGRVARLVSGGGKRAGELLLIRKRPTSDEVSLREVVHQVAMLVLVTFVRRPRKGERAHRIDFDPRNNRLDNLQWKAFGEILHDDYARGRRRRGQDASPTGRAG